jgi:hypothetical protein
LSLHLSLTPSPSPKERGITPREAILWFLKFQTYQKKSFENNLMALIEGIPLSSGEGPGVRPIALIFFPLTFQMITKKIVTSLTWGPRLKS